MTKRRGTIVVMFLFFVLAFGLFSKLVFDIGRWMYVEQRLQGVGDAALLSCLRIRVDSLQIIAQRWNDVGRHVVEGYANEQMLVPSAHWTNTISSAETLRRAISGYRGRVSAVMGVVLEANRIPRSSVFVVSNAAHDLGVVAQNVVLRDEYGHLRTLVGGWYRRNWGPTERLAQPSEQSHFDLKLRGPGNLLRSPHTSSRARMIWDVEEEKVHIQTHGNGGFPRNWPEALNGNRAEPNRYAVFSTRLE